jgi:hypothetical protein
MGGFGGDFRCDPQDVGLVRCLCQASARRAEPMHLRWHFRLRATGHGTFMVDGNWVRMSIFMERLRRDLPIIAEATTDSPRRPAARRRLGNGFADVIAKSLISGFDDEPDDFIPRIRLVKEAASVSAFDLFPTGVNEDLLPRLFVTMDVLGSWCLDEIPPEVVLEELHTAAELLLTRWLGMTRAPAFSALVDKARAASLLDYPSYAADYADPAIALDPYDLLISLKDQRKKSKHRGDDAAATWLEVHFWPAVKMLEHLAEAV